MKDYTGQKFSRWTVIKFVETEKYPHYRPGKGKFGYRYKYLVRCDCGTERIIDISTIIANKSKSCGCLITPRHTDLRATYNDIKKRCYHKHSKSYRWYGALGIALHPQWHDYNIFYTEVLKEVGERPVGYTLDRVNPLGNYEPGNIKWSTPKQQARNRKAFSMEKKSAIMFDKFLS